MLNAKATPAKDRNARSDWNSGQSIFQLYPIIVKQLIVGQLWQLYPIIVDYGNWSIYLFFQYNLGI